jgi:hypothetical protein
LPDITVRQPLFYLLEVIRNNKPVYLLVIYGEVQKYGSLISVVLGGVKWGFDHNTFKVFHFAEEFP